MVLLAGLIYSGCSLFSSKEILYTCVWNVFIFWLDTFRQITLLLLSDQRMQDRPGIILPCPLTFLLQLVIMSHQLNLCSIGFLYILGKGIWKLSNVVVVMLKVQNYRIHLVSMNPETKFSFMFSWEKGHKTKMIVDCGHLKWTLMPYSFSSRVVACLPQTYIGFMAKQTKHPSPKTFEEAANYDP